MKVVHCIDSIILKQLSFYNFHVMVLRFDGNYHPMMVLLSPKVIAY